MSKKIFARSVLVGAAALAAVLTGPAAQADVAQSDSVPAGEGITVAEFATEVADPVAGPPSGGWDTPSNRSYHLLPSCDPYAGAIREGASAWAGLTETESGGTPVECRNSYIDDCGQGGNIVGCNWGSGQRIALYMGGVGQDALLAAHEFGHDWYGHSGYQCASWQSPEHVMAPSICGFKYAPQRID